VSLLEASNKEMKDRIGTGGEGGNKARRFSEIRLFF
jgi:hypothetical protein